MPVTFVTFYYNIYNDTENLDDFYLPLCRFIELLKTRIHIILFTTEFYSSYITQYLQQHQLQHQVQLHMVNENPPFSLENKSMPDILSQHKDTAKFLNLMNLKSHFMKRAIYLDIWPDDSHFAWIDFRITKIFQQLESTLGFLQYIGNEATLNSFTGLVIPGCWPKGTLSEFRNRVNWRFCGGFYIGNRNANLEFHQLYEKYYSEFFATHVTWEVNFWAWLENQGYFHPNWYYGDHNDSMVTLFPNEFFTRPLIGTVTTTYLTIPSWPDFHPSSMDHIVHQGKEWLNIRNINYYIDENNCYHIAGPKITTINSVTEWPISDPVRVKEIEWNPYPSSSRHSDPMSYGLEDLRLWHDEQGQVRCLGTNWDHTSDNCARIAVGHYDLSNAVIDQLYFPGEPTGHWEKNWAPFEYTNNYVYKWSADTVFTGCILDGHLEKIPMTRPNYLFKNVRGSSKFLPSFGNNYIGVVHYSEVLRGKKIYYHMMVELDKNGQLKKHTDPFYFLEPQIEFCIGYHYCLATGLHRFWVSKNDECPFYMEVASFNWHTLPDDLICYKQPCQD